MSSLNIARFEQYIAERRITHGKWLGTDDRGRELACFYAALAPDGVDRTEPGACPAEAMPAWLADLLPWLDDSASTDEERYARARRLVPILRRVGDPQYQEALRRADYACRAVAVREARAHATGVAALAAIDGVLALLDRAAAGEAVSATEWEEAAAHRRTGLRADLQRTQAELDGLRDALAAALQRSRETRRPAAVEEALRVVLGDREATAEELARLPEVVRALGLEEWEGGARQVGRALRRWQRRGAAIEGRILEGRMRWSVAGE